MTTERIGAVLIVRIDRPATRNAIDREVSLRLAAAVDLLDGSKEISVGILTGVGEHFSAGMDLKAFESGESIEVEGRGIGGLTRSGPAKPIIAAVEGFALAGGFELALACDMVVAGAGAVFGLPEVARGLMAGSGGLIRLSQRIPFAIAAEYAYTGRRIGVEEAGRWGIVNRIVDDGFALSSAIELAEAIAANSPFALAASKSVMRGAIELSDEQAWRRQDELLAMVFASEDAQEGARAFVAKRAPVWRGR